jgi:hypothetical protein
MLWVAARRTVLLGLAAWTIYWLVSGWAYMQEHSIVVQQGFGGDGIQMWEIFNLKMVAAHHAIRWAAGAVLAALTLRALARKQAEAANAPQPASAAQPPSRRRQAA